MAEDVTVRILRFAPPGGASRAVAGDGQRWRRRDGETPEAFEARVLGDGPIAVMFLADEKPPLTLNRKRTMRKLAAAAGALALVALLSTPVLAGTTECSGFGFGTVWTVAQWTACFGSLQPALGYTPLNKAGDTMTGELNLPASTSTTAALNLGAGVAPTAPVDGDIWATTSGLYAQINGATVGPFGNPVVQSVFGRTGAVAAQSGDYTAAQVGALDLTGGTLTGKLTLPASTTAAAPLNLGAGVAPTTPTNGDVWATATGLYAQINGSVVGPLVSTLSVIKHYLSGCILSNDATTPSSVIDVTSGAWTDDTGAKLFASSAGTVDLTTTGANGLDTGTVGANTWYAIYEIGKTDGTTALLASSAFGSSVTMPSGYTLKRRIGDILTDGSSNIVTFVQHDNRFVYAGALHNDYNTTNNTTAYLITLSVPPKIAVTALIWVSGTIASGSDEEIFASPDLPDVAPSATGLANFIVNSSAESAEQLAIVTNTTQQIRERGSTSGATLYVETYGWVDDRGQN